MKEYIFENTLNSNITIIIKADNVLDAIEILSFTVEHPEDFKRKL